MSTSVEEHIILNNQIMVRNEIGELQLDKDKEAIKSYVDVHLKKRLDRPKNHYEHVHRLVDMGLYDPDIVNSYISEEIWNLYEAAYSFGFEFQSYVSIKKFYDSYALRTPDKKLYLETYEDRLVIVSMFFGKGDYNTALSYLELFIKQLYQPATPTFLNAGKHKDVRGEFISCFLLECGDSLNDINMMNSTARHLSKIGGGISVNLTKTRAKGETLMGVEGATSGVVPIMVNLDQSLRHINQAGQREGAGAVYLHALHADIIDFIGTKRISVDPDFRVRTLSTGVCLPDVVFEYASRGEDLYLLHPHNLKQVTGKTIDDIDFNTEYYELINDDRIKKTKISALSILQHIAVSQFESGYPFIQYTDNVNRQHPLKNMGNVNFSNLCTEIEQYSISSEYKNYGEEDIIGQDISCILGSLNIASVMKHKNIHNSTIKATEALTVVTDESSIENAPAIKKANENTRSIGLGAMNLHGYLTSVGIPYESEEAKEFADVFFSTMNYWSLVASCDIAIRKKETFVGFEGSAYHTGVYFERYLNNDYTPKSDKIKKLFKGMAVPSLEDWKNIREKVMTNGLYHGYRLAIAPTGSISYIQSSTPSVMPISQKIEERIDGKSKTYYPMPGLSSKNWFLYKEAYDMDMFKVVDLVSTMQRHIDQGISFTIYIKDSMTTRDLSKIIIYAHYQGIKTIYYARQKDTGNEGCLSCKL